MSTKFPDSAWDVPRNPNVSQISLNEILPGGVRSVRPPLVPRPYIFAYKMKATKTNEPEFNARGGSVEGYLNCFQDGFVFLPDVPPSASLDLAHFITHLALGKLGAAAFSYLGDIKELAGESTATPYVEALFEKMGNKRKMFQKALAAKGFFFLPYAELIRFRRRVLDSFYDRRHMYILSHQAYDGTVSHYELLANFGLLAHEPSLDPGLLLEWRLEKEVEDLALGIMKKQFGSFRDLFIAQHASEYDHCDQRRRAEIDGEYRKQLSAKLQELGYSEAVTKNPDGLVYLDDKKFAAEILEKMSPTLAHFRQAPQSLRENVSIRLHEFCGFA